MEPRSDQDGGDLDLMADFLLASPGFDFADFWHSSPAGPAPSPCFSPMFDVGSCITAATPPLPDTDEPETTPTSRRARDEAAPAADAAVGQGAAAERAAGHRGEVAGAAARVLPYLLPLPAHRFNGSSFKVIGDWGCEQTEWAIVGGTGEFKFSQGVITVKTKKTMEMGNIKNLKVHAVCLTFGRPLHNTTTKIGPWGAGGRAFYVERPRRLISVTIRSNDVLDSLAFSYIDQAGATLTAGPWGGDGGSSDTIIFDESESIKEVSGTTAIHEGQIVVSSLTLVTNLRSCRRYGKRTGTPFSVPVGDNSSIVGFFVRAGRFVDAIGVYVHISLPN